MRSMILCVCVASRAVDIWARMGFEEMSSGNASVAGAVAAIVVAQMVIAAYILVAYYETTADGATNESDADGDEATLEDKKAR